MSFCHLNVQTDFSFLMSSITIPRLLAKVQSLGMGSVAVTDHMNLFGAVSFMQAARKASIRPIVGARLYLVESLTCEQGMRKWDQLSGEGGPTLLPNGIQHLNVLVKNQNGYQNLCRLLTWSYEHGLQTRPVLTHDVLKEFREGLILLSGPLMGDIPSLLAVGEDDLARARIQRYREWFGDDFYLEAQSPGTTIHQSVNHKLAALSQDLSIPVIATNDCHYLEKSDADFHKIQLNIGRGRNLQDPDHAQFATNEHYVKSEEEMRAAFADFPSWCDASTEVASRCQFELKLYDDKGGRIYHLPLYPTQGETLERVLDQKASEGMAKRGLPESYRERLEHELKVIHQTGFSGYFLIVADFISWAKEQGIPVGPGRGSGVGSLVAFSLGITDLDPVQHGLLFERFLNPERISMPDFDIDFCMDRREEVIQYVRQKYGNDRVAKIINFGKMQARAVLRDVGRVYGVPHEEMDRFAKKIPNELGITLEKALQVEPALQEVMDRDPRMKEVMHVSLQLEGMHRHAGIHAAGVIIADAPITNYCPLYQSADGQWMTQVDGKYSEEIGLIKFDFLGLKTLTGIQNSVRWIQRRKKADFNLDAITIDDVETYQLISQGDTIGVFQLEGHGMQDLCRRIAPTTFDEITAINALYRPGPLDMGMHEEFIRRKKGEIPVTYELPQLQSILNETYGIVVYQEQVQRIAVELAGYTLGGADILRRAMGKKKPEEMAKQRAIFLEGALKNKLPRQPVEKIFELMESFAQYGFNKSHAAAYMMVAFQTAYLKRHYPVEFYVGVFDTEMGKTDKVSMFVNDARKRGIKILPPCSNSSEFHFLPVDETKIRYGLGGIKGVGTAAAIHIAERRAKVGGFKDFFHFLESLDLGFVNKKCLESLIKSGALDWVGFPRARLMTVLPEALKAIGRQKNEDAIQTSLFDGNTSTSQLVRLWRDHEDVKEWDWSLRLQMEFDTIGAYLSGHPLEKYLAKVDLFTTHSIADLGRKGKSGSEVTIAGVAKGRERRTRTGEKMAIVQVEDMTGGAEVIVFPQAYSKFESLVKGRDPLLIKGKIDEIDAQGKAKIIVGREGYLKSLDALEAPQAEIHLVVDESKQERFFSRLAELFRRFPGPSRSYIHVRSSKGETCLRLPSSMNVAIQDELVSSLVELCGRQSVRFELSSSS